MLYILIVKHFELYMDFALYKINILLWSMENCSMKCRLRMTQRTHPVPVASVDSSERVGGASGQTKPVQPTNCVNDCRVHTSKWL